MSCCCWSGKATCVAQSAAVVAEAADADATVAAVEAAIEWVAAVSVAAVEGVAVLVDVD